MLRNKISILALGFVLVVGLGFGLYRITRNENVATGRTLHAKKTIVALGDSVAAGVGLPTSSDISLCNRTDESYPKLLALDLGYNIDFLACSGATVEEGLIGKQAIGNGFVESQISQLPADAPVFITLTIGADDLNWVNYLTKCVTSICGTDQDEADISSKLDSLATQLSNALISIKNKYGGTTTVYITGYYHLYPLKNGDCAKPTLLDDSELAWIANTDDRLNGTLKAVAEQNQNSKFVPIDFSGHLLCDLEPWINSLEDGAPYHPNSSGQKAIATSIKGTINQK